MQTRIRLFDHDNQFEVFPAGAQIFGQGEGGDHMYIIIEGEVDIVRDGETIATLGKGLVFGETSLLEATPRNAAAYAKTACRLVALDMKAFLFLVDNNRGFALDMMRVLTERLQRHKTVTP